MPTGEKTLPDGGLNFGSSQGALAFGLALTQAFARCDDLGRRRDLVDEAHLLGCGGLQLLALEQHLQRVRRRHEPRDPLRAAAAGEEADLDLRQADPRLVAVGGDAVVAGERQLEAAAHADAVDRDGDRLAAGLEPPVDDVQFLRLLDEGAHRRLLALVPGPARVFGAGRS